MNRPLIFALAAAIACSAALAAQNHNQSMSNVRPTSTPGSSVETTITLSVKLNYGAKKPSQAEVAAAIDASLAEVKAAVMKKIAGELTRPAS